MLNTLKNRKKQEGFTIIEVLIVLAIAGLILLIVFLAVPALQRNSRNTQRRSDVAALLGAVQEFTNNNSGKIPTPGAANTAGTDAAGIYALAKFSYYTTSSNVSVVAGSAAATANPNNVDKIQIVTGVGCGTGGDSGTTGSGSQRSIAALFTVESASGGKVKQCQES